MLNKFKKIPILECVHISSGDGVVLMKIDGRPARGYLCTQSAVLSIFIDTIENFPLEVVKHISLLLAGCSEVHDYSLKLSPEGGWLCCFFDKNMTVETMAKEIEKHLALTRYLDSTLSRYRNTSRRREDGI